MRAEQLAEHYRQYAPVIHRRCRALLGDPEEALDATQDVFITVARKLETFRGESDPLTWIYRIATNHCLNLLRSRKVRRNALARMAREQGPAAGVDVSSARQVERRELLGHLLDQFDARRVQMLLHRHHDGMTQVEIAEVMGVSERTVRKTLKEMEAALAERNRSLSALKEGE